MVFMLSVYWDSLRTNIYVDILSVHVFGPILDFDNALFSLLIFGTILVLILILFSRQFLHLE